MNYQKNNQLTNKVLAGDESSGRNPILMLTGAAPNQNENENLTLLEFLSALRAATVHSQQSKKKTLKEPKAVEIPLLDTEDEDSTTSQPGKP